ncbi:MAG TPA: hypothetical protein VK861_06020, partial [Bacteroidales bacterium]|nr:hypothetical protein [Bacteroidales bacterium]
MKNRLLHLILLSCISAGTFAQTPQDIYRKPLKEVLIDIGKRYDIKLVYNESLVKGINVEYASWRYRADVEATLSNILLPLEMTFEKSGDKTWQISRFSYHQRPVEEGRKHLDRLLSLYPDLRSWE